MSEPPRPSARAGPEPTAVIFDLDGTLVQTREASWRIFADVSRQFGLGIDRPEEFWALLDDNLFEAIRALCDDERQAAAVKAAFLAGLERDYHPHLVPGIGRVLRPLAGVCTLAVLSGNATSVVRRILEENDLAFCFAHVFGSDLVESKRAAIHDFLTDASIGVGRRCSSDYDEAGPSVPPSPATTVLVTDTKGDVHEALAAGIRAVGVSWGMHTSQDLRAAGAEFVAAWPQEIATYLFGDINTLELRGACALPPTATPPTSTAAPLCRCGRADCEGDCRCDRSAGTACATCTVSAPPTSWNPNHPTTGLEAQADAAMRTRRERRGEASARASAAARVAGRRVIAADAAPPSDQTLRRALRTILR